jgi:hypothetical protein
VPSRQYFYIIPLNKAVSLKVNLPQNIEPAKSGKNGPSLMAPVGNFCHPIHPGHGRLMPDTKKQPWRMVSGGGWSPGKLHLSEAVQIGQ